MKDFSVGQIFKGTISFLWFRILVYVIFFVASIALVGILGGIAIGLTALFNDSTGIALFLGIMMISAVLGFVYWARRYVLYLVKAGHVAVITNYMLTGEKPEKASLEFCKKVVKEKFKEISIASAADALIEGAVRQILRFLTKTMDLLSFIPGADTVKNFVISVLSTAANYIDEAVLAYIFLNDQNAWKSAKDGVVLYAKSWKELLKTALKTSFVIWLARIVVFILGMLIFGGFYKLIGLADFALFCGILTSCFFTMLVEGAVVEPYLTVSMIRSYLLAIQDKTPDSEMMDKLTKASSKFRKLNSNAQQVETQAEVIS